MKYVYSIFIIIVGFLIMISKPLSDEKICFKSGEGDSTDFGFSLATNGDYFVVGDPTANRVVIYSRLENGKWDRTREVRPPKGSRSEKIGSGFGYSLALKKETLVIGSYIEPRFQLDDNHDQYTGEVYYLPHISENINSVEKINFSHTGSVVGFALSVIDNEIAIGEKKPTSPFTWIGRILVVHVATSQITKVIEVPNPQEISRDFGLHIDGANKLLLIGAEDAPPLGRAYLATLEGDLERVPLDKAVLSPGSVLGSSVALTDDLIAIGRSNSFGASDTLLLRKSKEEWSFIDVINLGGVIDADKSHVLISAGAVHGMPSTTDRPDHLLIEVTDNTAIVKSEIRWKFGKYFPRETKGLIDSGYLYLSQQGKVVRLSIANLPSSYVINNSHCKE